MENRGRDERRIVLSAEPERYPAAFGDGSDPVDLASLLYEDTPDEWRRRWRTEVGSPPRRELLCNVAEFARGASASAAGDSAGAGTTRMFPDRDLALRTFERPMDPAAFVDTVVDGLNGADSSDLVVYVDALDGLIEDAGVDAVAAALERLRDALPAGGAVVCRMAAETPDRNGFERIANVATDVVGVSSEDAGAVVDRLRRSDPTNYGYARRHWEEARQGIERCGRNYPQAKQIHERIADPETTPRTLGATLKALVEVGVIDVWSETVGPTRYDLTTYDADRLRAVGEELDASD